jgi:hypothetical protein
MPKNLKVDEPAGSDAPPLFSLETGWKAGRFPPVYHFPCKPLRTSGFN